MMKVNLFECIIIKNIKLGRRNPNLHFTRNGDGVTEMGDCNFFTPLNLIHICKLSP